MASLPSHIEPTYGNEMLARRDWHSYGKPHVREADSAPGRAFRPRFTAEFPQYIGRDSLASSDHGERAAWASDLHEKGIERLVEQTIQCGVLAHLLEHLVELGIAEYDEVFPFFVDESYLL